MLIINAKVHTMEGPAIDNGWVQVEEDKIRGVGRMDDLPEDGCQSILDAKGGWLFPGFIDAHTHLGMWEDGLGFEGDDGNEDTDPCTPQLRAIDAVNPMDYCFTEALQEGVTTVITGPGSANAIGGQMAAIKTMGKRIDDMIIKAPVAMKFALGENPKTSYHGKSQSPVTRMATASIIREQLSKAVRYYKDIQAAAKDPELEEPEYDAKCEALIPLFRKEVKAHFHAHRCDDIFTAMRIAKEFDLEYVIIHGTQGHKAADVLAKEKVDVLAGPVLCDRSKPELKDLTPANPGILDRAGIRTSIVTDHPVIPIQYLPLCAGLAVREGMEWESAIQAITLVPAKVCGIEDRVGSIRPGKDADLVLFDGNPLTLEAKPLLVLCNGQMVK